MWPLLRRLIWDETAFVGLFRAACLGLGTAVMSGQLDPASLGLPEGWSAGVSIVLFALGGFARSSSAKGGE